MKEFISIENDGPNIIRTNYFETANARTGFVYLSINAGAFRLLVPDEKAPAVIGEVHNATEVIVTRGPWPEHGRSDGLEIMFEDGTDNPYALHLGTESIDRLPADTDRDRKDSPPRWRLTIWTSKEKIADFPCRYRLAKRIPWMKAWQ